MYREESKKLQVSNSMVENAFFLDDLKFQIVESMKNQSKSKNKKARDPGAIDIQNGIYHKGLIAFPVISNPFDRTLEQKTIPIMYIQIHSDQGAF